MQSTEDFHSDPPAIDNTQNSELQLNHIICESTDDESETENTLSINMLQVESEYETPVESNYYQNNNNNHFQISVNTTTDYTEKELKGSSNTNNIYTNITNKVQLPTEKFGQIHYS